MVTPCQRNTKVSGKEGGTCVTLARMWTKTATIVVDHKLLKSPTHSCHHYFPTRLISLRSFFSFSPFHDSHISQSPILRQTKTTFSIPVSYFVILFTCVKYKTKVHWWLQPCRKINLRWSYCMYTINNITLSIIL